MFVFAPLFPVGLHVAVYILAYLVDWSSHSTLDHARKALNYGYGALGTLFTVLLCSPAVLSLINALTATYCHFALPLINPDSATVRNANLCLAFIWLLSFFLIMATCAWYWDAESFNEWWVSHRSSAAHASRVLKREKHHGMHEEVHTNGPDDTTTFEEPMPGQASPSIHSRNSIQPPPEAVTVSQNYLPSLNIDEDSVEENQAPPVEGHIPSMLGMNNNFWGFHEPGRHVV